MKFALESFWAEETNEQALLETRRRPARCQSATSPGSQSRRSLLRRLSLYDHVLDTPWALGAIPSRFGSVDRESLGDYFGLARGTDEQRPLEMTKWFDTNCHYLVPELERGQRFELRADHC